jgi:hypothetical protein
MPLDGESWPPDYKSIYLHKDRAFDAAKDNPAFARAYYKTRPVEFIHDWCFTVDPRNASRGTLVKMPFALFERQQEYIEFLLSCLKHECSGLVEKSRDTGVTWTSVAFSVWLWLYWDGAAIGFGSRKEMLVDRLGDMDSIFEKIRAIVRNLPPFMLPIGFKIDDHATSMKLINPETAASITGEAGSNIGRGGRKLIYFKDESAHYEQPESIEAALMDNTNVQIDISSVNGTGNVFHRRRLAGEVWHGEITDKDKVQVFLFDWRDHPAKDQAWYDRRRAKAEADGLLAEFAQEVDRDYSSSVLGTVIKAEWIEAAIGFAEDFEIEVSGKRLGAMDVADDSLKGDKNAFAEFYGMELRSICSWGQVDTSVSAIKAVGFCRELGIRELQYDSIGVGAGVKGQINQLGRDNKLPVGFKTIAWVASGAVLSPHSKVNEDDEGGPKNRDFFGNFKAQAWWRTRTRLHETWKCREGLDYDPGKVISISRNIPKSVRQQLVAELSQPTRKETTAGKMIIDKSPSGASSPNLADAFVIGACPSLARGSTTESVNI